MFNYIDVLLFLYFEDLIWLYFLVNNVEWYFMWGLDFVMYLLKILFG